MNKKDIVFLITLLLIGIVGLFAVRNKDGAGTADIYVEGKLYGTYDLATDRDIRITGAGGIINEIRIEGNSVYMADATCPSRDCVRSGRISHINESICCMPSHVMIVIGSGEESGYDAITK